MKSHNFITMDRLPDKYLLEIGRLVSTFAMLEAELRHATHAALGVDPKHRRIAVRSPRSSEFIGMIRELLELDSLKVGLALRKFAKVLEKLDVARDVICHSVWFKVPGDEEPWLQDLSGSWSPDPRKPPVKKRIHPQGIRARTADIEKFADVVLDAAMVIANLGAEIRAARLEASEQK